MKSCSNPKCIQQNPQSLTEFYKNSKGDPIGHCKTCKVAYEATRRKTKKEEISKQKADYYQKNKQHIDQKSKEYHHKNRDEILIQQAIWRENNKQKVSEQKALYYEENRPELLEKRSVYREENLEKIRADNRAWQRANPGKVNANVAKRWAAQMQRTPKWLTEEDRNMIEWFYIEAARLTQETKIQHHVDHIVPLQGKEVSGLHVPWNLQILTATENIKKGNRITL
jgi:hypothetical protein